MSFLQTCLGLRNPKNSNELLGIWERIGDDFSGCLLQVEREEHELVGKIIVSTPQMLTSGWNIGDRKWRRIESDPQGSWQLMDLRKQYDTKNKKVVSTDYAHYWISLRNGGRKLYLHQSKIPLFAAQTWSKRGS